MVLCRVAAALCALHVDTELCHSPRGIVLAVCSSGPSLTAPEHQQARGTLCYRKHNRAAWKPGTTRGEILPWVRC